MKRFVNISVGILAGLALTALILWLAGDQSEPRDSTAPTRVAPVPDSSGTLAEVIVHYTPMAERFVMSTYQDLITSLDDDVIVWVAVENQPHFDQFVLQAKTWSPAKTFRPVLVNRPITTWSRDRYTLVYNPEDQRRYLAIPVGSDARYATRANDWLVPWKLADVHGDDLEVLELGLRFDGGDLIASPSGLFADFNLFAKNVGLYVETMQELHVFLSELFETPVVLLGASRLDVPTHHIGMYFTPLSEKRVMLGDPELAVAMIGRETALELGADLSEETLHRFSYPKQQLQELGYEVVSLPLLPLPGGVDFITYNNVLLETRDSKSIVYMPVYDVEVLDEEAARIWQENGFEVRRIRVKDIFMHHGSVRCLINVVDRR